MQYFTELLSNRGGRNSNQDYADFAESGQFKCWIVADGLGGHAGGELASRLAVTSALQAFLNNPGIEDNKVWSWLEAAQNTVLKRQSEDPAVSSMRTTIVLLAAGENSARWSHIGDSRIYMFRGGQVFHQSKDHSVTQALADSGQIDPSEIRMHEDRSRLLRTLGNEGDFRPVIYSETQELVPGDAFLLCSDGFWEYVLEQEMIDCLKATGHPGDWLLKMEEILLKRVTGTNDNYTAMAVIAKDSNNKKRRRGGR